MIGPEFIAIETVLDLHEEAIRRFGGARGIRDRGAIESALGAAFLAGNGHPTRDADQLYAAMIGIAERRLTKADLAQIFRELFV